MLWMDDILQRFSLCNLFFLVSKFLQLSVGSSDIAQLIVLACCNFIYVNHHIASCS
jgi:hypothetical protein